jgi:hypothetical protein
MKYRVLIPIVFFLAWTAAAAQDADPPPPQQAKDGLAGDPAPEEPRFDYRYAFATIDDASFCSDLREPLPTVLNQFLLEPSFSMRYDSHWSFSSSLVGVATTYEDTSSQIRVKETYVGLSAGDFDFTLGRKILRWGTGYAFTAAGVLDPPRVATNPSDRLNLNEGRDLVKADWVHGSQAFSLAWSSDALDSANPMLHNTAAFRYNVLVHGFDTSLIAGNESGGDSFGGLTFTRVLGQAWEVHGEAVWRQQGALLLGGKYTTRSGIAVIGELYTPPNIPYYRDLGVSPRAGRQHYGFFTAGKSRLRERPGWKWWDLSASIVADLDDRSYTAVFDTTRRFGNHFSSYLHLERPAGSKHSEYGSLPYSTSSSIGIRFQI